MKIEIDGIEYLTNEQAKEALGFKSKDNQVSKVIKKYIKPLKIGGTLLWKNLKLKIIKWESSQSEESNVKTLNLMESSINL